MKIEGLGSVKTGTEGDFDTVKPVESTTGRGTASPITAPIVTKVVTETGAPMGGQEGGETEQPGAKDPTQKTIDAMMSEANQKLSKTRCEYSCDEPTRRVSIKVYDKETDQLIREVPPEKSLEALQKIWELAGIIVDEKR